MLTRLRQATPQKIQFILSDTELGHKVGKTIAKKHRPES